MQVAYNKLFEECRKLKKLKKKTIKIFNEVEFEKENLRVKLDYSHALVDKLKLDIGVLNERNK